MLVARTEERVKAFEGWKGDFQGFFIGLKLDNSKRYFEANRRLYEEEVKGPLLALMRELEPEFGPGKVFRLNRDLRFSADKSPYKTNIAGDAERGGYVHLDGEGLYAARGWWMVTPGQLARYREAVARPAGDELQKIVASLEAKNYTIGGDQLKRVPPPHPQDHPRGRLLRQKGIYAGKHLGLGPWLATSRAKDLVAEVWRDGGALTDWLDREVGPD